jgi:Ca2+/Na+ antiporter
MAGMLAVFVLICKVNLFTFYKEHFFGGDALAGYKISYWTPLSFSSVWKSVTAVANGLFAPKTSLLSTLTLLFLFAGLALVIYSRVKYKDEKKRYCYIFGCWILPYFIFFTFWDSHNTEFKLNILLPLMILIVVSAAALQNKIKSVMFVLVIVAVFFVNMYFFILPANDVRNNPGYRTAEAIGTVTPPGSIIVIGGCGTTLSIQNKIYISYFAYRRTFILDWMLGKGLTLDGIRARILLERKKGAPVYFFSEITRDSKTVRQILENHNLEADDYFKFLEKLEFTQRIPLNDRYYLDRL